MRVLIVRTGAMGDVLHALPAVAALRAARPDWAIDWVIDPRWQPLIANGDGEGPLIDHVHLAETRLWSRKPASIATLRSILGLRRELRAARYDLAVDVQGTLRSAVITRFTKAERRFGFETPREPLACRFYTHAVGRQGTHIVEQNAALLSGASGVALRPSAAFLPTEAWADSWATELVAGRRVCILAPSAGWAAKQWPNERFAALAMALRERGYRVLVNAARKDDALPNSVVSASEGAAQLTVCNVAGLIALTRQAALFIGGDSGPTHLAAALAVPTVALFGPTDPARNGPWGPGLIRILRDSSSVTTYKRSAEVDPGLLNISPEAVLDAVHEMLGGAI